ncbi:MAG: class I SAM-dependent methyltransferase, partial [Phocaeicola dorei]
ICGDLFTTGYSYPDYVRNMNVLDIPFKENSFDIVLCNHVLEHIENDQKAMQELYKVLKKTGIAILQVPIASDLAHTYENSSITEPELRIKHFGQKDHVRLYGMDYKTRLESVGFKVDMVNIADRYPKYGLNPFETLYICHK